MFTDRYKGIHITNVANELLAWTALDEAGSRAAFGWDSLSIPYIKTSGVAITIEEMAAAFPIGQQLTGRNFWVQDLQAPTAKGGGVWIGVVNYKGLAGSQPVNVSYGSSGEQQSASPATINSVYHDDVSIHQNTPTATARYIQLSPTSGTTLGQTENVGTAQTPADAPDSPPNFWTSLATPIYHFPNGWVLMGSDVDKLTGTNVGLVTDTYQFIQEYTPG